jgi:hypothetical protein
MSRRPRPARPVARAVGLLAGGALLLAACGTDGLGGESVAAPASTTTTVDLEPLELTPADPAAVLQSEDETFILDELRDATFYSDLPCGPDVQQAFDYAAPSTGSRDGPLVVFIHGGGFTKGDKDGAFEEDSPWTDTVVGLLAAGVPVASINYRLIDESNTDGVITPLTDSQRCLQGWGSVTNGQSPAARTPSPVSPPGCGRWWASRCRRPSTCSAGPTTCSASSASPPTSPWP